jgi:hypothetical protein
MVDLKERSKVRALKRLVVAVATFQQVIAACEFLISQDSDEHAQFYGIFFSGICVSYMRPFMSAERLGSLSANYRTFPDNPDHARTHEDLMNGRNWAYAHYSPEQAAGLLANTRQQEEQKKIRFVLHSHGITFHPPEINWPKSRLPAIVSLCRFQIEHVKRDCDDLVKHLTKSKIYKHGEYIIGETFP